MSDTDFNVRWCEHHEEQGINGTPNQTHPSARRLRAAWLARYSGCRRWCVRCVHPNRHGSGSTVQQVAAPPLAQAAWVDLAVCRTQEENVSPLYWRHRFICSTLLPASRVSERNADHHNNFANNSTYPPSPVFTLNNTNRTVRRFLDPQCLPIHRYISV